MAQVAFPAIRAAYGADPASLRGCYLRVRTRIDAGCLIFAGLLAGCGDRIVHLLYDARYAEAGGFLRILALSLVGIRFRVLPHVFLVMGRPRLMLYEQVTHVLCLVPAILVGKYVAGPAGAVWGVALSYVVAPAWNVAYLQPRLGLFSARTELQAIAMFAAAVSLGLGVRAWI